MMMTRARRRRRRLHAEESSMRLDASTMPDAAEERRDWADLTPDLVGEISGRLLSSDVAEYLRFRSVCKPWRDLTEDPRAGGAQLCRRFRPRNWMLLSIAPDPSPRRRLLNLATAASLGVDLPAAFPAHCHLCAADGLLVLYHRVTKRVRVLDPLTNALTEFPAISRSSIVAPAPPRFQPQLQYSVFRGADIIYIPDLIDGAGFDDSTSPPTLVLCLRGSVFNIVVAKPGDARWTLVRPGQGSHRLFNYLGRITFHSLLSEGGRCYFTFPEGSVYLLQLLPVPQLVELVNQRNLYKEPDEAIRHRYIVSFLVSQGNCGRMLMVRYLNNIESLICSEACKPTELFTVAGVTSRIELLEVDLTGRRLVPLRSLGHHAVFVGDTHCVLLSTKVFPSLASNAIYLGYRNQDIRKFSVYHLKSKRTEPPYEFVPDKDYRVAPSASPWNLDEYLVCYVDRRHALSGPCINHRRHMSPGREL